MGYRFTDLITSCQLDSCAFTEHDVGLLRSTETLSEALPSPT